MPGTLPSVLGGLNTSISSMVLNASTWNVIRSSNFTLWAGHDQLASFLRFYSIIIKNTSSYSFKVALDGSTSATGPTLSALPAAGALVIAPYSTQVFPVNDTGGSAGVRRILYLLDITSLDSAYYTAIQGSLSIESTFYPT